ncbi:D-alanyl-lipoteichoic acid biosynthesis protein DltB [Enterococcus entomosocium]|uniref:Teichoic acid D-alanyltransferase n=1 Tax=Enterococcus entomosocium TaxID=3034352 RepID=A0ABV3MFY5_9ENTE|nr:D-alanyl-lipoteichoic acid biosynthesis protein DltB [Enterococcus casseliflavus]MDB1710253.1 D-alanyl-lipoteichoic acid biosynthesis protein DltB [Enterococcus casseliflavus]MDB1717918.1 D-alanyl-lipoteichoic acid biosynthesis protein DltB [Enterococcus casseliflavus]
MNLQHMIPYANPTYFIWLMVGLLPMMLVLLFKQKRWQWYQTLLTLAVLYVSFGGEYWQQGLALIGYVVYQTLLVYGYYQYRQRANTSGVFYSAVVAAILPLALSKVTPFFVGHASLIYFLGISYLTFKSVQMIMEIRDGLIKEYHPWRYIQFLLYFPTISSGPIDRYRRFEKDLLNTPTKEVYLDYLNKGVAKIMLGLLYKFILGYYLGQVLLPIVSKEALQNGLFSWGMLGYMYVYSMYLFFDFAGYSLFAIGVSNFMGYDTPANFNKPFLAPNIKEFWNRWHMSLSFWFRDYVYMRLMFTLIKKKVFKSRIVASNVGYFALFLLMGIWHGLTWYYILYGVYHATLICGNDAWIRWKKKQGNLPSNNLTKAVSTVLTFQAVCFSFLIFSGILDKLFVK